jgi:hypothetical protein
VFCGQNFFVSYLRGTLPSCLSGHKEKMKGVKLPSPISSTFFKKNGGLKKQQNLCLTHLQQESLEQLQNLKICQQVTNPMVMTSFVHISLTCICNVSKTQHCPIYYIGEHQCALACVLC